ncbi:MAG: hypothetical protein B6I31_03465 [Desulfobacteraceae bacterium 4572_19]|nr:MAG: hypothetical protein B6I31_03465 [Desulfobacteraceae bacterium 4572_19]
MKDSKNNLGNKKRAERIEYPAGNRPLIKITPYEFEVENISLTGLKFSFTKKPLLAGWQTGTIIFTSGEKVNIDFIMVSHENGELGMHLLSPLPLDVVSRERNRISSGMLFK